MPVFSAIGSLLFGAGTFLAGLTATGLQIAAGLAMSAIAKAVSGEQQQQTFSVQGKIQGGDDVPRSINLGWNTTAGSLAYQNEWGEVDKTPNAYSTRVIAIGDIPVQALVGVDVAGSPVTLLTGQAHPTLGIPVAEYRKNGRDYLWIKFHDGSQTTADPLLTGTVSSAARPYSARRIGRGVPYVIATSLGEQELFKGGFPQYKFTTYGAKLYDISKDSSVGGVGTHRWNNPATWGGDGDFLPAVQLYNLLRGVRWNGQWLYGLQDLPAARLPAANWIAQINKCRAGIAGPSGTEPTYRTGGELQVGAPFNAAVEALLTSCQGRLVEVGGAYKLYVGEPGSPVTQFDDGHIISTEEQSFTPFFGLADTINGVSATYPNPTEVWNSKVAPPLLRPDLEVRDGNRRLMASVSLDMVPYPGQVQRLMKSALLEALRARRHTFVLPPEFQVLEPGDIVEWTSARNGYVSKLFRVDGVADRANLDVLVDITEVDPSDYDWDQETDYRPPVDGPVIRVTPAPQAIVDFGVSPYTFYDTDSNARKPGIQIVWDGDQVDVRAVVYEVVLGTDVVSSGEFRNVAAGWGVISDGLIGKTAYEVHGRYDPYSARPVEWSALLTVTTPDIPEVNNIQVIQLGEELRNAHGLVTGKSLGSVQDQLDELREQFGDLANAIVTGDETSRRRISTLVARNGSNTAAIIRNEVAIAEADKAIAELSEEVVAVVNDALGAGLFKIEGIADGTGASAQILMKVRAMLGDAFSEAALRMKAIADGVGGTFASVEIMADRLVFISTTGEVISAPFSIEDGVVKLLVARASRITSQDGVSMVIDFDNPEITFTGV